MEEGTDQTTSSRSKIEEDQYVKVPTVQLAELLRAIDETRNILNSLCESTNGPHRTARSALRHRKSWWGRHCWPSGRRFLYRNITIITVILQFLNLLMLTVIDVLPGHLVEEYKMLVASSATMITFEVANLFILILATGRLAKQVFHHAVNSLFLAQSYMATLLLFAGLYTLTYRLDKHSWRFLNEDLTSNPIQVFNLYFKFLFYSISTATLCGSDNALPVYWYNHLFAGTQMLLSFCYFASILGMALNHTLPSSKGSLSGNKTRGHNLQREGTESTANRARSNMLETNWSTIEPVSSETLISSHQERQQQDELDHNVETGSNNCNGVFVQDCLHRQQTIRFHQNHQHHEVHNDSVKTEIESNSHSFLRPDQSHNIQYSTGSASNGYFRNVSGDDDEPLLRDGSETLRTKSPSSNVDPRIIVI